MPAGSTVEWYAVLTQVEPNEKLAWESVEGSAVRTTGVVHFRPVRDGATEIDVHLLYAPPGGAIGHAVATVFGVDPKRSMDEDLVRLKSLNVEAAERAMIQKALEMSANNRTKAAELLGIRVRTLRNKLNVPADGGASLTL